MKPSLIILQYYSTYHRHRHVGLQCLDTNIIQVGCVLVVVVSELVSVSLGRSAPITHYSVKFNFKLMNLNCIGPGKRTQTQSLGHDYSQPNNN